MVERRKLESRRAERTVGRGRKESWTSAKQVRADAVCLHATVSIDFNSNHIGTQRTQTVESATTPADRDTGGFTQRPGFQRREHMASSSYFCPRGFLQ